MIKAVIFDWFGVLYPDTYWTIVRRYTHGDESKEIAFHDLIGEVDLGRIAREDFWDSCARLLGISRPELDRQVRKLGQVDDELMHYIRSLRQNGLKTSIISNVGVGFLEQNLASYDHSDYFDDMVLSSTIGVIKPDPAIYRLAADRLDLAPSECVFVDDIQRNVDGAEKVGMQGVLYKGVEHLKKELKPLVKSN